MTFQEQMKKRNLADVILYNGTIHTVNEANDKKEGIAIKNNEILATGDSKEMLALQGENTQIIDLQGRSVIPGIIDSHNHLWEAGLMYDGVLLFGIGSIQELKTILSHKVKNMKEGQWLQGGSWIETQFTENRMPNRWDLDEASPEIPVVLERIFAACSVNSKALQLAGIHKNTADPEGGRIERDEKGEATGVLHGKAVLLVRRVMPGPFGSDDFGAGSGEPSTEVLRKAITLGMKEYAKLGITSIVEPGVSPTICRVYQNLKDEKALTLRVNLMPNWYGFTLHQQFEKMERFIEEMGIYTGFGDSWLRLGGLKMAIDGGLTSGTALKSWPYLGEAEPREVRLRLDLKKLDQWVMEAHLAGWTVGIHVMGDIAIEKAVDAIYKAYQKHPVKRRHQLIHAYYPTEDSLKKMAECGAVACVQGSFIYGEADGYMDLLPEDKRESFTPIRSYMDHGVVLALSTDMPCASPDPFLNMYSAVTRRGIKGFQLGTKEAITMEEALRAITLHGAWVTEEENIKGSLEPGKLADLVVLNKNIAEMDPEELKTTKAEKTMVDGKWIYESQMQTSQ